MKNCLPGGNKGYIRCNWLVFYSEKRGFNRCDCIPPLRLLTLLWYSIATGGGSILAFCQICVRSCQICVSFDKFVSDFAKFVFFLGKRGFYLQLVGVLFSHFAKFVLFLCQICVRSCKICAFFSEKGVFNRCDCIPLLGLLTLLRYSIATGGGSIATGWYFIVSKMILTSKKAPGGDCPGCS